MTYLTEPVDDLERTVATALAGEGFTFAPLTESFHQYLARALGDATAWRRKSAAQLLAELNVAFDGSSVSHLTMGYAQLLDTLNTTLGGSGGGGDVPTPIGIIDLENNTYSWGASSKSRGDLFGTDGPWVFADGSLTANGYEGEAYAGLLGEALTAVIAGTVVVFDCTVSGAQVQMELHDAPGFNTDGLYFRADTNSGISDGNGGGSVNTATGQAGRAKVAYLITAAEQSVSDNGGAVATCDPDIQRPSEPNRAGMSVGSGCILHSIKFYSTDTDLQVVSAA